MMASTRPGANAPSTTSTSALSPSHVLLSSLLDLDAEELVQHEYFLQDIMNDVSIFSLNQQISPAALAVASNTKAALAAGNALLAKWLAKIMSMIQRENTNTRLVGLRFLTQTMLSADHTMISTQHEVWSRVLLELAKERDDYLPTAIAISALGALVVLFNRALLWPDTWRDVSSTAPKYMSTIVSHLSTAISKYTVHPKATEEEGDVIESESVAKTTTTMPSGCVLLSELSALTRLSAEENAAVTDLLRLAHDALIRTQLNQTFRPSVVALEAIALRLIDIGSPLASNTSETLAVRDLAAKILALLPHATTHKSYTQSLQHQQTQHTQSQSQSQLRATIASATTLVTVVYTASEASESKVRIATVFEDDDVGAISSSSTDNFVSAASSATSLWSVMIRRLLASAAREIDTILPRDALRDASFYFATAAQEQPHSPGLYILPAKPTSGNTLTTAEILASRVSNIFRTAQALLTTFPIKAAAALAGSAAPSQASKYSRSSSNNNAMHKNASALSSHTDVVTLPQEDFVGALPLFEALSLIQGVLALETLPVGSSGSIPVGDERRLSSLSYSTVLPALQTAALEFLRVLILASRRFVIPHARRIAGWVLAILARTAPSTSETSLTLASNAIFVGGGSAAGQAHRNELRRRAYEVGSALLSVCNAPVLYKTFVEPATAHALADVTAFVSRSLLLIREGRRALASAAAAASGFDDDPLSVLGSDSFGGDDDANARQREKRRVKKQKREQLLASLPGATFGVNNANVGDVDDEEEEAKNENAMVDEEQTSEFKFGVANPSSFGVVSGDEPTDPTERRKLRAKRGHSTLGTNSKSNVSSAFASLHKSLAALAAPKNMSSMPCLIPETAVLASQRSCVAAIGFVTTMLSAPALPAVMTNDLRAAIDRTLLTALLALIGESGILIIRVPVTILHGLFEIMTRSLTLPSVEQSCLSAILPYASRLFRFAASSSEPTLSSIGHRGLVICRNLISPAAPPPSLSAPTVALLHSLSARAQQMSSQKAQGGLPSSSSTSGFDGFRGSSGGFSSFSSTENVASGETTGSSSDSSFPLHLFHYQQLFSYTDVDEEAVSRARPSQLMVLTAHDDTSILRNASSIASENAAVLSAANAASNASSGNSAHVTVKTNESNEEGHTQAQKASQKVSAVAPSTGIAFTATTAVVKSKPLTKAEKTKLAREEEIRSAIANANAQSISMSDALIAAAFENDSVDNVQDQDQDSDNDSTKVQEIEINAFDALSDDEENNQETGEDVTKSVSEITLDGDIDDEDGDVGLWSL